MISLRFDPKRQDYNVAEIFSEHKFKVNVARFHPNGEWIASGGMSELHAFVSVQMFTMCGLFSLSKSDERGRVLVWALNSKMIKLDLPACRSVMDLAWSEDGQKIVAVGDGAER